MPAEAMAVSALIVAVFVLFGAVLYWGERRTRDLSTNTDGASAKRRAF